MKLLLWTMIASYLHQGLWGALLLDKSNRTKASVYNCQRTDDLISKLHASTPEDVVIHSPAKIQEKVSLNLLSIARRSRSSRQCIIEGLLRVFRNEALVSDTRIRMAYLLSKLGAVEAIDILVNEIDLRGTVSSLSLNSRPMVDVLANFGEAALPYLVRALRDERIIVRQDASIALGYIGGDNARKALQEALRGEPNEAVVEYIRGALSEIDLQRKQVQVRRR